ncbi:dienelactone hydrolase family protein [Hymenobacter jeollabukensis]|uniref:Dienelactone hydrolase family protein n=1 Tax=Hymenobacter jeollabukensis TaxID=2025313 RepID=A0A5R8WXL5_9BACT|nr:dienelactone hydrolase family protein [Hymenobacter jeollabukensis]TLM96895.1 dienelactone hydrolase family protein [Hymenobacter jeollabukensis]
MKHFFFSLLALLASTAAFAQKAAPSCCAKPAPDALVAFASLAADPAFMSGHDSPLPLDYQEAGKLVTYPTPDSSTAHAYQVGPGTKDGKYLLVIHEWWGLNDYIKREADRLAASLPGVTVLAVDLYDGKLATTADEASRLVQAVDNNRAKNILRGALTRAGAKAQVATLGWCFGGGWSLQAALLAGKQAVGCVMYYGMPEKDVAKLKTLNTDVLGLFATQDQGISPAVVKQFQADMKKASKQLTVHNFDAVHAFANPSNPKYDAKAATQANTIALNYLLKKFKLKA